MRPWFKPINPMEMRAHSWGWLTRGVEITQRARLTFNSSLILTI